MNPRGIAASICAVLLLSFVSTVAEPKKQKEEEEEESSSPYDAATRSKSRDAITNEDLERMMEEKPDVQLRELPPTPPPAPKAAPPKAKPKGKVQAKALPVPQSRQQPRPQPQAQRSSVPFVVVPKRPPAAAAGSKVAALESRVADLEKAILAAKNPALPREWTRPKGVPPGTLKDREMQLRQTREELAAARQEQARRRGSGP